MDRKTRAKVSTDCLKTLLVLRQPNLLAETVPSNNIGLHTGNCLLQYSDEDIEDEDIEDEDIEDEDIEDEDMESAEEQDRMCFTCTLCTVHGVNVQIS